MAGPYGRTNRDLFGSTLNLRGRLIIDENAKLTVPNACVEHLEISGNIVTGSLSEQGGQEGINIVGNINMGKDSVIKTESISEINPDEGVSITNPIIYDKLGQARAYISTPMTLSNIGTLERIVFDTKSYENSFGSESLIHNTGNINKTFVVPDSSSINVPIHKTLSNAIVQVNMQIQANVFTGSFGDTITTYLIKNDNVSNPLVENVYTLSMISANNHVHTISMNDIIKVNAGDQLDYFITSGNISGSLFTGVNIGSHRSYSSFNIISFE